MRWPEWNQEKAWAAAEEFQETGQLVKTIWATKADSMIWASLEGKLRSYIAKEITSGKEEGTKDAESAIALYELLQDYISPLEAGRKEIWYWMACGCFPDLVALRHGSVRTYFVGRLSWFFRLWWSAHLSKQPNDLDVWWVRRTQLTDSVQGIIERPGKGYRVNFMRALTRRFAEWHLNDRLFRHVLKLAGARAFVVDPDLHPDGYEAFINDLFEQMKLSPSEKTGDSKKQK